MLGDYHSLLGLIGNNRIPLLYSKKAKWTWNGLPGFSLWEKQNGTSFIQLKQEVKLEKYFNMPTMPTSKGTQTYYFIRIKLFYKNDNPDRDWLPLNEISWYYRGVKSMHFFPGNFKAFLSMNFSRLDDSRYRTLNGHLQLEKESSAHTNCRHIDFDTMEYKDESQLVSHRLSTITSYRCWTWLDISWSESVSLFFVMILMTTGSYNLFKQLLHRWMGQLASWGKDGCTGSLKKIAFVSNPEKKTLTF